MVWAHLQCSFELESKLLKGGYIGCYSELLSGLLRGLLGVRACIEKCLQPQKQRYLQHTSLLAKRMHAGTHNHVPTVSTTSERMPLPIVPTKALLFTADSIDVGEGT